MQNKSLMRRLIKLMKNNETQQDAEGVLNNEAKGIVQAESGNMESSCKGQGDKEEVEMTDKLKKRIVEVFGTHYQNGDADLRDKRFTLWVGDRLLDYLIRKDFQEQLQVCLSEEGFTAAVWGEIRLAIPPKNHDFIELMPLVFLQVEVCEMPVAVKHKARITVVPGKGSLVQAEYFLDPSECQHYNIGVGVFPQLPNHSFRENYIAIEDDVASSQYENNKFVSRTHAYIGFSEELGFYLQVEAGGSRVHSGNRTQIFRKQQIIEVENLDVPVPLQSGDIIVLGKTVALNYKTIC